MSIGAMCALAELSRAGYYRFLTTPAAGDQDIDLRDAIQRIALEFPTYGRPRMTEELHRRGWQVGAEPGISHHAGGQSALPAPAEIRGDHQLQPRPAGLPNLARDMVLTGINQLWVADITHIRLETEFVYLAVILDAYSTDRIRAAVAHASTIGASRTRSMRFFRHGGIYRSDVGNKPSKPGAGYRLPLVGPEPQPKDATGGTAPCS